LRLRCDRGRLQAGSVAIFWLPAHKARPVAARARKIAGDDQNVEGAVAALREASTYHRTRLTEHSVAMGRADDAAKRLDAFMDSMRGTGTLKDFSKAYTWTPRGAWQLSPMHRRSLFLPVKGPD
jgi:hypothetical protein